MISENSLNILKRILSTKKNIVFVCIGTPNLCMDAFGPNLGSLLKEEGYTVYGTDEDPITRKILKETLTKINKKHKKDYIIAIDAAASNMKPSIYELGEIIIEKGGLIPASYLGGNSQAIGNACIKMVCIQNDSYILKTTLEENTQKLFKIIKENY